MGDHKKDHGYQIFDNGTFPVLSEDWTAEEEILLLDGVEQHGYGNWDDIADHISTKTPEVTVARGLNDISDHTLDNGELAQCLANPPEALELPVAEQQELGYMPNRDDFERLCCSLKMKCTRYVTIKGILLKDYVARKHGIQSKTRYPPNLTKQQRRTIVEFLNEAGWTTEQKQ
eukprot:gene2780-1003_t